MLGMLRTRTATFAEAAPPYFILHRRAGRAHRESEPAIPRSGHSRLVWSDAGLVDRLLLPHLDA